MIGTIPHRTSGITAPAWTRPEPLAAWWFPVSVASPDHLPAMTMAGFRPGKDQSDLELLFDRLGITTASEAADVALSVCGPCTVVLPDRDELLLSAQAVVDRLHARKAGRTKPGTQGRKPRGTPTGGRFDVAPHGEPDVRL